MFEHIGFYPDVCSLVNITLGVDLEKFWWSVRHGTSFCCCVLQMLGLGMVLNLDPCNSHRAWDRHTCRIHHSSSEKSLPKSIMIGCISLVSNMLWGLISLWANGLGSHECMCITPEQIWRNNLITKSSVKWWLPSFSRFWSSSCSVPLWHGMICLVLRV